MSELVSADLLAEVAKQTYEGLIIRPGDKLIIRVGDREPLEREYVATMRQHLMIRLPELRDVIVIQCDGLAVVRGDDDG